MVGLIFGKNGRPRCSQRPFRRLRPRLRGRKASKRPSVRRTRQTHFKNNQYHAAFNLYTNAIKKNPTNVISYINRSMASYKLRHFNDALIDVTQSIALDNSFWKAYYRRAIVYIALHKYELAHADLKMATEAQPDDKNAAALYLDCKKKLQKIQDKRSGKAIAVDQPSTSFAAESTENMSIEYNYQGPKLKDETITEEFVMELIESFKSQKLLHKKYAHKILMASKDYLKKQPTLINIEIKDEDKFTICGDIHGQYYDLCNIFEINGMPSVTNSYLFNGDFVDRGSFSVECIFVLFAFKLLYPDHFFIARGNHESIAMNRIYGFEAEVKAKYDSQMFNHFTEVYNWLPLAHCINNKVLVMHGGLSAQDFTLDDIKQLTRNIQPPNEGIMCDLLWSDPSPIEGTHLSPRGKGILFGPDITDRFIKQNNLLYIVRSHQVKRLGYEKAHNGKCITIFSAPNYCDVRGNSGAYLTITGATIDKPNFYVFNASPHPDVKALVYASKSST